MAKLFHVCISLQLRRLWNHGAGHQRWGRHGQHDGRDAEDPCQEESQGGAPRSYHIVSHGSLFWSESRSHTTQCLGYSSRTCFAVILPLLQSFTLIYSSVFQCGGAETIRFRSATVFMKYPFLFRLQLVLANVTFLPHKNDVALLSPEIFAVAYIVFVRNFFLYSFDL